MTPDNPPDRAHRSSLRDFFGSIEGQTSQICLVRHAEAAEETDPEAPGPLDTPLTSWGKEQSRLLARRLRKYNWNALYASPLTRTAQTARILGRELGLDINWEPDIREVDLSARAPEEMSLHDVYDEWDRVLEQKREQSQYPLYDWDHFEFAETGEELRERVMPGMSRIVESHRGGRVLVITHGGVINIALGTWLGMESDLWFMPENTSLNVVRNWKDHFWLERLNDVGHLE